MKPDRLKYLRETLLGGGVVLGLDGGRVGGIAAVGHGERGPEVLAVGAWRDLWWALEAGKTWLPSLGNRAVAAVCFETYHKNPNGNSVMVPEIEIPAASVAAVLTSFGLPYEQDKRATCPEYFRPMASSWRKAILGVGNLPSKAADDMTRRVLTLRGLVPETLDRYPENQQGHVLDAIAQALYAYEWLLKIPKEAA